MSSISQFSDIRGPRQITTGSADPPEIIVITAADANTHVYDLSTSTYFNGLHYKDRICSMVGEGVSVYYHFSENTGGTVDKTATGSGATVGAWLPASVVKDDIPAGRYLTMQLSAAGTFRMWISNNTK